MKREAPLNLDREQFLACYWQQKPLLIRNAITGFTPPIDADELAGLALNEDVESRIIEHRNGEWLLSHGPFAEADYQRNAPWTLLVQAVDHIVDDVAQLRKLVDFIPQWRVDDVMVSYAVDGGSVGPHYDNYDVFLLQGEGQRLWHTGQFCDESSPLLEHEDLRILSEFDCQETHLLNPGDILYVPPGVAHWGIAKGPCTTFSIGFRAPRLNAMVSRFADALLNELEPDLFYHDVRLEPTTRAGEIRQRDRARVQAQLQAALDQAMDDTWFGELVTEPRYDQQPAETELEQSRNALRQDGTRLTLVPGSKLAWQHSEDGITVFANGESCAFPAAIAELLIELCGAWELDAGRVQVALRNPDASALIDYLLETGCIDV